MKELIVPLDYFPGLKDTKSEIPEEAILGGHGIENTVAKEWHKGRPDEWVDNVRDAVLTKQWKDNDTRRESHSKKMTETWENNYEHMAEQARKNGRHGLKGKDIHNTLDIEYKGVIYYGWSELKEKTGVSKHLYKKYYEKGIDPEPRIGKDGPVRGTKYK